MTAQYELTARAVHDLAEVIDYLKEAAGPVTADHVLNEFVSAFQLVAERPAAGHRRDDLVESLPLRFWAVHSWLVVYAPRSKPITIVTIVHGARDPEDIGRQLSELS